MSRASGLPTCVAVPPELLVLAVRGAIGGSAGGEALAARAIRDHRDLLPEHVRHQLIDTVRGWLNYDGARASAAQRAPWVTALRALGQPTVIEAARARRARWLELHPQPGRHLPAGYRS